MKTAVFTRAELAGEEEFLTSAERAVAPHGARSTEWALGRAAAHRVLGDTRDVLVEPDGAPRVTDAALSLSHDADWIAVAVGEPGSDVAIDLCALTHTPRVARILARLGVVAAAPPCAVWAALECALKLRRRGVWFLLDAALAVRLIDGGAVVRGIGEDVIVRWEVTETYALAWAEAA
jgi:hypothetical protein